ncbi:MAG: Mur ligase domain-containing protein, partial [Kiloniellaceae bacterium]
MSAQPLWSAADAAVATGGHTTDAWTAAGVSIDTRTLAPGDLFVALKGPSFDGHDYIADALAKGAAAAVTHRPAHAGAPGPLLIVRDTLKALRDLGRAARARAQARVVAVTGSVGKTSVKV